MMPFLNVRLLLPLLLAVAVLRSSPACAQALRVQGGATLRLSGDARLLLSDTRLQNDGAFEGEGGEVRLEGRGGDAASAIGGSVPPRFGDLVLAKSDSGARLEVPVYVAGTLRLVSGSLDLNGHDLYLSTAEAMLEGETEANRVWGDSGEIVIVVALSAPSGASPGQLGLSITSPAAWGSTTIRRGHARQDLGGGVGIYRYYRIEPGTSDSLQAELSFSYLEVELAGMSEGDLELWRKGQDGIWSALGASGDAGANTLAALGVQQGGQFTMGLQPGNPLPVGLLGLEAACAAEGVRLEWATAFERQSRHFQVERSADGLVWQAVGEVPAAGHSEQLRRYAFEDREAPATAYYRLRQYDADGAWRLSPVVAAACAGEEAWVPRAFPSPTAGRLRLLSGQEAAYEVFGLDGRRWASGRLAAGEEGACDLSGCPSGAYVVRFRGLSGEVRAVKVLRL